MEIPQLTQSEIEKFLDGHTDGGISGLSLIGQGEWSLAYSFQDEDGEKVIRFSNLEEDFQKDRFAANFASPHLPIPKITDIGQAFGGFYAISEKVDGKPIDNINQGQIQSLLPALFDLFEALRLADISRTTGYGIWKADGNAPHSSWRESLLDIANDRPGERISGWKAKLTASSIGIGSFNRAYQRLVSSVDICPEERYLIHSDLLHFNLLVAGSKITAVLDWGSAKYGDFLYELAWFSFWAPWFPSMKGLDFRKESLLHYEKIGLEVPNFEERMKCCEIHIGLDSLAYGSYKDNWDFVKEVAEHTLEVSKTS